MLLGIAAGLSALQGQDDFLFFLNKKSNLGKKFEHRFTFIFHLTIFLYCLLLARSPNKAGNKKLCSPTATRRCTSLELLSKPVSPPGYILPAPAALPFKWALLLLKGSEAVLRHPLSLKRQPQLHFKERTAWFRPLPNSTTGLNNYWRQCIRIPSSSCSVSSFKNNIFLSARAILK